VTRKADQLRAQRDRIAHMRQALVYLGHWLKTGRGEHAERELKRIEEEIALIRTHLPEVCP
jgi:hypothetical protein